MDENGSLQAQVTALAARVSELEERLGQQHRYPSKAPTTWYDVEDWAYTFFGHTLELSLGTRRWCAQWYHHPEAATRIRLLYESYHQTVGTGDAWDYLSWWSYVLEPQLDALLDERGPFSRCTPDRHIGSSSGLRVQRNPDAQQDWGPRPSKSPFVH